MGREKRRNQYHPSFYAAMELELREDKGQIEIFSEYVLNTKPNTIDFLVIKTNPDMTMQSGLGAIFKKYNLVEYKSPRQQLDLRVYRKALAYASLLEEYSRSECSMDDITITFIRRGKPAKLMKQFREMGLIIRKFQPGIYHITGQHHVDMQVIVTKDLGEKYQWITKLTERITREDLEKLYQATIALTDPKDRLNAESVLDLVMRLNQNKAWWKEEHIMGELRDLFKKEFEERDQKIEELSEELQSKDEELQSKDEELQSKDEELQSKDEELQSKDEQLQSQNKLLIQLQEEIDRLRKQLGNQIASL